MVVKEIPYTVHVDPETLKTANGDYVSAWQLEGVSFLTSTDEDLNALHEGLHKLLMSGADEHVVYYTHVVRRAINIPEGEQGTLGSFAYGLSHNYYNALRKKQLYVNELYLSVVFSPEFVRTKRMFAGQKMSASQEADERTAMEKMRSIALSLEERLRQYGATRLSTYSHKRSTFSALLEFYQYLINGEVKRFPLVKQNLQEVLLTSRTMFNFETGELRTPDNTIYVAALGMKTYPTSTFPGQFSVILGLPFEFVLTQSFASLTQGAAREVLRKASSRLSQTEHDATSEIVEISGGGKGSALDDLAARRFILGEHHLVLLLKASSPAKLNRNIARARKTFSDAGEIVMARESLALEAAFWSQLPGNMKYRPRPTMITSRNAAGLMALFSELKGKASGNHWGNSVVVLRTVHGTPYHFNFHVDDVGHSFICGPTGSGKTTVQLFLSAMMGQFGITQVFFDYGRGSEVYVWSERGKFFALKVGEPTGMNPFQMEPTQQNINFVTDLFIRLVTGRGREITQRQQSELESAVQNVFTLPKKQRRASSLIEYMNRADPDGLAKKLARWVGDGQMAWLFDNEEDTIDFSRRVTGFNIKEFIDNDEVRTVTMMYLFHRMTEIDDGRRLRVDIGEFWKALDDDYFSQWVKAFLNTKRKDNAMFVGETQSPEAVVESTIAHTIIGQTATKLFLWNAVATEETYMDKFGLNRAEYEWVKMLGPRRFLLKQLGQPGIVLDIDLGGEDLADDLAVLSGTNEAAILLESIRKRVGDNPDDWIPHFRKERKMLIGTK